MLQRKIDAPGRHSMNFCEVEVRSCWQFSWGINVNGTNCSQQCYCAADTTCRVSDGHCYECPDRRYGNDCSQRCSSSCAGLTCRTSDGQCEECVDGRYGTDCSQRCYCANNEPCSSDGQCQECPAGRFGQDCSQQCYYCPPGVSCGRQNGECERCPVGKYGSDCSLSCNYCSSGVPCGIATGVCSRCPNAWYGVKCDKACNCATCNIFTGYCGNNNCHPGFIKRGGRCEQFRGEFLFQDIVNSLLLGHTSSFNVPARVRPRCHRHRHAKRERQGLVFFDQPQRP